RRLHWRAISRGLAIDRGTESDSVCRFTAAALTKRRIDHRHTSANRTALTSRDLASADLAIALCEVEHRPMSAESHPLWVDHIVYWSVRDLPFLAPEVALPEIEREVFLLLRVLSTVERKGISPTASATNYAIRHVAPNFTRSSLNGNPFDKKT